MSHHHYQCPQCGAMSTIQKTTEASRLDCPECSSRLGLQDQQMRRGASLTFPSDTRSAAPSSEESVGTAQGGTALGRREEVGVLKAVRDLPRRSTPSDYINLLIVLLVFVAIFGLLMYWGISRLIGDDPVPATLPTGFACGKLRG